MAGYVKLQRSIWTNRDFLAMAPSTQRLYLMLISQGDLSAVGVIPITCGRWAHLSTATSATDIRADLERLADAQFIVMDDGTEELWVRTYIEHDEGHRSPNGRTALKNACARVVSPVLRNRVIDALRSAVDQDKWCDVIPNEAPGEGASEGASEAPGSPQQPADVSHKTAASSQPGSVLGDPLSFLSVEQQGRAAAAIERWITHRLSAPDVKYPAKLEPTLRKDAPRDHHGNLARVLAEDPDASVEDLCVYALKMPRYAVKESA
jgi:hypothetical protein